MNGPTVRAFDMSLDERISEARAVIRTALDQGKAPCLTSSFQADCVALVQMVVSEAPGTPVLFLDTGYHFPETYAYRDEISDRLKLNLVNVLPRLTVAEQESQFGILYESAPDRCCGMRKVEPLFSAVEAYDTWFTALRRDQSPTRANLQHADDFLLPSGKKIRKISPLAAWTMRDVWAYVKSQGLPFLPLYDQGYTSVGCAPCTAPPLDPDNPRSGRWGGRKLECGIHIQAGDQHA
jgi:phosphoadenosine phosphosulfate reductase